MSLQMYLLKLKYKKLNKQQIRYLSREYHVNRLAYISSNLLIICNSYAHSMILNIPEA